MTANGSPYANRYSLWYAPDEGRLGVSWSQGPRPVAGYVIHNADSTWSIEHHGEVLPKTFAALQDAVEAVLKLDENPN
jgi:hypothetical protein